MADRPRMTDKMAEALLGADRHGFLPPTSGAVLGRLYKLGYAKDQRITDEGRAWVEQNRLPAMED